MKQNIASVLKEGGVGVLATDTLYGLVGSAQNKKTVERIYTLRRRNKGKPMIILISQLSDLQKFSVKLNQTTKTTISYLWPGKVSIILTCPDKKFQYLHRGKQTLAFRLPKSQKLVKLIRKTGPLVAPSANIEGEKPALTISEAKKYFGNKIDFYQNSGKKVSQPSTLVEIKNQKLSVLRQGAVKIK